MLSFFCMVKSIASFVIVAPLLFILHDNQHNASERLHEDERGVLLMTRG